MERDSKTLAWHTSVIVGGTPKEENLFVIPVKTGIQSYTSNTDNNYKLQSSNDKSNSNSQSINETTSTSSQTSNIQLPTPYPSLKSNVGHILISQVQITGGTGKTDDDFIEIYNPTSWQVNLKGYRLVKRAQNSTSDTLIKSWATNAFIPAFGFYLWANSGYTNISVAPDATTSESISDDNGIAIRYGPNDTGAIIDSLAWGKAQNVFATSSAALTSNPLSLNSFTLNPSTGQSLLRKGWQNNVCLSAEFDTTIGNGCDTGNNALDFELIQASEPRDSGVR
jgi:hypothetical protein